MESLLLEQLDNLSLLKGERPNRAALTRLSKHKILDLLRESVDLTSAAGLSREQSIFCQSATLSLSGGRVPCFLLDHRLQAARNLSQYAALYADKIYIYNILGDHVTHHKNHATEEELKAAVYCDLVILGRFRPLIESGRIIPITPPDEFCPVCFGSNPGIRDLDQRRKTIRQWLSEKYLRETELRLERTGDKFAFVVTGPDVLLKHGTGAWIKDDLPDGLKARWGLVTRLTQGKTIKLSRDASRLAKIYEMNADEILRNVFFELICSQCLGTSFLTERPLDIDVLNKFSEDHALAKRNHLVQEHLTAFVPFLASVRIRDLLALRDKEGDSFLAFRQALTRAIDDYKGCQNQRFNAQDASQLYGDVIEPELAKLDVAFKTARRRLLKGSGVKVVSWVGAIAFGLYSGFIPQQLEQAAQALGLTKILAELGSQALGAAHAREELASNDTYFLWRVEKISQYKRRQNRSIPGVTKI